MLQTPRNIAPYARAHTDSSKEVVYPKRALVHGYERSFCPGTIFCGDTESKQRCPNQYNPLLLAALSLSPLSCRSFFATQNLTQHRSKMLMDVPAQPRNETFAGAVHQILAHQKKGRAYKGELFFLPSHLVVRGVLVRLSVEAVSTNEESGANLASDGVVGPPRPIQHVRSNVNVVSCHCHAT